MDINTIDINDYTYHLPDDRIARYPLKERELCLLLEAGEGAPIKDNLFKDIPKLIPQGSLLVYNDSKVIHARLHFRKGENESGANIEIFCLEPFLPNDYQLNFASVSKCSWKCLVGNSRRWKENLELSKCFKINGLDILLKATRIKESDTVSIVTFTWDNPYVTFSQIIETVGEIPIPPYLNRKTEKSDNEDYQTVYSRHEGSVAAPTAGLHFTNDILKTIDEKGIERCEITLHVGAGTFKPVTEQFVSNHEMHFEFFSVHRDVIEAIIKAKSVVPNNKIYAVGTTSVRTLESLYYIGCLIKENKWEGNIPQWYPYGNLPDITLEESLKLVLDNLKNDTIIGETQIIIVPGFKFRIVDGMITNFHQPNSTLLLLISAFIGRNNGNYDLWKDIYAHAMSKTYRFLSYGDACLFH